MLSFKANLLQINRYINVHIFCLMQQHIKKNLLELHLFLTIVKIFICMGNRLYKIFRVVCALAASKRAWQIIAKHDRKISWQNVCLDFLLIFFCQLSAYCAQWGGVGDGVGSYFRGLPRDKWRRFTNSASSTIQNDPKSSSYRTKHLWSDRLVRIAFYTPRSKKEEKIKSSQGQGYYDNGKTPDLFYTFWWIRRWSSSIFSCTPG